MSKGNKQAWRVWDMVRDMPREMLAVDHDTGEVVLLGHANREEELPWPVATDMKLAKLLLLHVQCCTREWAKPFVRSAFVDILKHIESKGYAMYNITRPGDFRLYHFGVGVTMDLFNPVLFRPDDEQDVWNV